MADTVGLIAEIFTWIGVLGGVVLLLAALVARLADGTWTPTRGVIEQTDRGTIVRWFDDEGNVNEATLSAEEIACIGQRDMTDLYYREGWRDRMRLHAGSETVHALARLAVLLLTVAAVAFATGWIALMVEG